MLDVHGESQTTWPASDALCAALQVINHLQDCGQGLPDLDRVYVPLDSLAAAGLGVAALGAESADGALRGVFNQAHQPDRRPPRRGRPPRRLGA